MRARRVKREYDAGGNILRRDLVFFGSYGLNGDGTAKFFNESDKHDNFSDGVEGVADSLLVKLNILEGELWYNVSYGWPLWDKYKSKYPFDVFLSSNILKHEDVIRIDNFESRLVYNEDLNYNEYKASVKVISRYGEVNLEIGQRV